ncbi:anion permease [Shigella flexneri]
MNKKSLWKLILILAIRCIIGFMPAPAGLANWRGCFLVLTWRPLWSGYQAFPEPVVLLIAVAASMVVVGDFSDGVF